jgi:SM-20-related protein
VAGRIMEHLPFVVERLDMAPFPVREIELQVTSSNDAEWFRPHRDSGAGPVRTRELTFVYYCHREPRAFGGGELRLFEPFSDGDPDSASLTISPVQNAIAFFPAHYLHEVCPLHSSSRAFADSRLTFNGWVHR